MTRTAKPGRDDMLRTAAAAFILALGSVIPAAADDAIAGIPGATPAAAVESAAASDIDWSLPAVHFGQKERSRGVLLPVLYVGLSSLHAFDAYSTSSALSRGAKEANHLMQGVAGHASAMWAVKGGVTAATIFTAERLWRSNRKAQAILLMVGSNAMMAAVAANNASVIRQQR
jgi:hypothetical protein